MARLPHIGGDSGSWGDILNDFLSQAHNEDGSLKDIGVLLEKYVKPSSGIPKTHLAPDVQASLDSADTAIDGVIPVTEIGVPNGVASLGSDGKVPATQIPVVDWDDVSGKPATFTPTIGSDANTAVAGNDARLSNERVPTANSVTNAKVADSALDQAKISGLTSALTSKVSTTTTLTNPTTNTWASVTIQDDGSSTAGWVDRFKITYAPQAGTARSTFWLNEYGEARGMPGKDNTVAARYYAAIDASGYAARSSSVPVLEVTDQRDGTRTTIFGVHKGGRLTQSGSTVGTVYTLEAGQTEGDIPASLPAGTLIVRKTA